MGEIHVLGEVRKKPTFKEWNEANRMEINAIFKAAPKYYIETIGIYLGLEEFQGLGDIIDIALFKCVECGRIITHMQFNFSSGYCGACDTNKNRPPNYEIQFDQGEAYTNPLSGKSGIRRKLPEQATKA